MRKILFILTIAILFSVNNANAITREVISACKQGAKRNAQYSLSLDEYFQKVIGKNSVNSNQLGDVERYIRKRHEEYKEQEATTHYQVSEVLLQRREKLPEEIELWRSIQMLTVDLGYVFARNNLLERNLGKSQDYYEIKIYDECMKAAR